MRGVTVPSIFVVLVALAMPARADDTAAKAEAAFDEGRRLVAQGNYAAACPKFELSYRLDPGIGALLNLADCHTHIGRTASAWAELVEAEDKLRRAGDKRQAFAAERIQAIVPRLVRLSITAPAIAGLVVTRDGVDVTALLGTAVPVDPGDHAVQASAPGLATWSTRVSVAGEGTTTTVAVPNLGPTRVRVAGIDLPRLLLDSVSGRKLKAQLDASFKAKQEDLDRRQAKVKRAQTEHQPDVDRQVTDLQARYAQLKRELADEEKQLTDAWIKELGPHLERIAKAPGLDAIVETLAVRFEATQVVDLTDILLAELDGTKPPAMPAGTVDFVLATVDSASVPSDGVVAKRATDLHLGLVVIADGIAWQRAGTGALYRLSP
jgi:Skp family chaperone for outer membrane proteins